MIIATFILGLINLVFLLGLYGNLLKQQETLNGVVAILSEVTNLLEMMLEDDEDEETYH